MSKKLRIGVIMGGMSAEYEISLQTGMHVVTHLDQNKYEIVPITISKENVWEVNGSRKEIFEGLRGIELVFNATHGAFGEDGRLQALLDFLKIPYTGSGAGASVLAFDKVKSRNLFLFHRLRVPSGIAFKKDAGEDESIGSITSALSPPWVVKPVHGGSSIGVSIIRDSRNLTPAFDLAFGYDKELLVEEYLQGREFTCGVIENFNGEKYFVLPVVEIIPPERYEFFDYEAKYNTATQEIVPAQIPRSLEEQIQDIARRAHTILGCKTYSRSDMIEKDGIVYLLETNTLPGLTDTSLYPKAARAAGLPFPALLDKIIEEAQCP